MVILSWEPDGADLFDVASCPWVMCKSTSFQLSPSVAGARKVELFILCLSLSLALSGAIFPAVLAVLRQVRKKRKGRQHCGEAENKDLSPQKSLVNLDACYCLGLSEHGPELV